MTPRMARAAGPRADRSRRRGILRAVTRTQMLIAGGVLGGVLLYLVLLRVHERNEAIKRRKEREDR